MIFFIIALLMVVAVIIVFAERQEFKTFAYEVKESFIKVLCLNLDNKEWLKKKLCKKFQVRIEDNGNTILIRGDDLERIRDFFQKHGMWSINNMKRNVSTVPFKIKEIKTCAGDDDHASLQVMVGTIELEDFMDYIQCFSEISIQKLGKDVFCFGKREDIISLKEFLEKF